jgi:hypothetical protein
MKQPAREIFRSSAHTSGSAIAKPKDYEPAGEVESTNVYSAWTALRATERQLQTGDILEDEHGTLHIAKFIGFERAEWWLPEAKPTSPTEQFHVENSELIAGG